MIVIGVVLVLAMGLAGLVLAANALLRDVADIGDPHDRTIGRDQFTHERRAALVEQQRRVR